MQNQLDTLENGNWKWNNLKCMITTMENIDKKKVQVDAAYVPPIEKVTQVVEI